MANFTSKILSSGISGINANQAKIATISNNIANVNTEGYARQDIDLEARSTLASGGGVNLGGGVDIGELQRKTSSFLERILRDAKGGLERYTVEEQFLERLEPLFSLTDEFNSIGSTMNQFFQSLDDLSVNPESIELRANVLQRAQDMVDSISNTYSSLGNLQDEADSRIEVELNTINSITAEIANLNGLIQAREASGGLAPGERDQRDLLLGKLAEKISFDVTEVNDGVVNITLPTGFALVNGTSSNDLEFVRAPSFDVGGVPPSLSGQTLGHIVYDYSNGAGTGHIELTDVIAAGDGILGGLLAVRGYVDTTNPANTSAFDANGMLVEAASRVEALARFFMVDFNTEYLGPDQDTSTAFHDPSAGDLNGNPPAVFGLFTVAGVTDADADGLPEGTDLTASGLDNFASGLSLTITNPAALAAGRSATGAGAVPYSVPQGDNTNILSSDSTNPGVSALQRLDATLAVGSYALSSTPGEAYDELVSVIGSRRNSARVNLAVSEANVDTAQQRRDEVSAVSLDEEFTNLISFQRAFEASSRILRIADELLENIVSLI